MEKYFYVGSQVCVIQFYVFTLICFHRHHQISHISSIKIHERSSYEAYIIIINKADKSFVFPRKFNPQFIYLSFSKNNRFSGHRSDGIWHPSARQVRLQNFMVVVFAEWFFLRRCVLIVEAVRNSIQKAVSQISSQLWLHAVVLVNQVHQEWWQNNHLMMEKIEIYCKPHNWTPSKGWNFRWMIHKLFQSLSSQNFHLRFLLWMPMNYLIPRHEDRAGHGSERWALELQRNCATPIHQNIKPNVSKERGERGATKCIFIKRINPYCCVLHNNL